MALSINNKRKSIFSIVLTAAIILLIPRIAMQFTDEVNWALSDFIVAGIMMLGAGFLVAYAIRKIKRKKYRIAMVLLLLLLFMLIWAEMAVGIFGSPIAGS